VYPRKKLDTVGRLIRSRRLPKKVRWIRRGRLGTFSFKSVKVGQVKRSALHPALPARGVYVIPPPTPKRHCIITTRCTSAIPSYRHNIVPSLPAKSGIRGRHACGRQGASLSSLAAPFCPLCTTLVVAGLLPAPTGYRMESLIPRQTNRH